MTDKPCTPRSAAKRASILDAAQKCFLENGYAQTSMDMVATKAGVSKATIYAHFDGKDQLFGAIICRRCDDQAEGLGAVHLGEVSDLRAALTTMAGHLVKLLMAPEVIAIYRLVVAESPRHPDLAKVYYEQGPLRGKQRIADVLNGLKARGLLEFDDAWQVTDLFVNMLRGESFHRALLGMPPSDRITTETTIRAAVDMMLRAYAVK